MANTLEGVFHAFAVHGFMDGRAFVKCLKDAGLLDARLRPGDADVVFAKHKLKGTRKMDLSSFMCALEEVSIRRNSCVEHIVDKVCLAQAPDYKTGTTEMNMESIGPERFFYDRSTYTGTHKCGGPSSECLIVTDGALVNRERKHRERQRQHGFRAKDSAALPTSRSSVERTKSMAIEKPSPRKNSAAADRSVYKEMPARNISSSQHSSPMPLPMLLGCTRSAPTLHADKPEMAARNVQDAANHERVPAAPRLKTRCVRAPVDPLPTATVVAVFDDPGWIGVQMPPSFRAFRN
eukprot:TRINITY_DN11994_c0_g1_i1.p1 TRINITY_DN11994_c0_g1~~TRINITY_DN11994_c0_g1_i1.p1  ORF type:complete len:293 (-),score=38.94 TRINITY_DN11994_c0_g1_i1:289-1167(-)